MVKTHMHIVSFLQFLNFSFKNSFVNNQINDQLDEILAQIFSLSLRNFNSFFKHAVPCIIVQSR